AVVRDRTCGVEEPARHARRGGARTPGRTAVAPRVEQARRGGQQAFLRAARPLHLVRRHALGQQGARRLAPLRQVGAVGQLHPAHQWPNRSGCFGGGATAARSTAPSASARGRWSTIATKGATLAIDTPSFTRSA